MDTIHSNGSSMLILLFQPPGRWDCICFPSAFALYLSLKWRCFTMQKQQSGAVKMSAEQFDLNTVKAAGVITKLWGRNGDVFARLRIAQDVEATPTHITLRIPEGMIGDVPITLKEGDAARIEGYLAHMAYVESLRRFLETAGESRFFDQQVPPDDLDMWRSIAFRRQNALVNVLKLESNDLRQINFVDLEGVIAKLWEYPRDREVDLFARLACYDQHAPQGEGTRNFGRVVRLPHYINIKFPGGRTSNGVSVALREKQRMRVRGELRDGGKPVTLREQLNLLGSSQVVELMNRVRNPELLQQISAMHESLYVLASAMVLYSR